MANGKFLLTLITPYKQKPYSTFITKTNFLLLILAVSVVYFLIYYPLTETIKTRALKKELRIAEEENASLRQEFYVWKHRIKKSESLLYVLKNRYSLLTEDTIHMPPVSEIGLGGIENDPVLNINEEFDEESDLDLLTLEQEILHFKNKVLEIQTHLTDKRDIIDHFPSIRPVKGGWISSGFGKRKDPFTRSEEMHNGLDFSIKMNTPVYTTPSAVA